ncbi:MAG: hypothetical protein HY731_14905, partial [Candidatus Tectomicrobia bacterium]|nr:hypothetical protein [Candidatus Tectomicrobia bacterium]
MKRYWYSAWAGDKGMPHLDPQEIMDGLSEFLLEDGDIMKALKMMMRHGMATEEGEKLGGIQDLLNQLRKMKQKMLSEYNLEGILDELKTQLPSKSSDISPHDPDHLLQDLIDHQTPSDRPEGVPSSPFNEFQRRVLGSHFKDFDQLAQEIRSGNLKSLHEMVSALNQTLQNASEVTERVDLFEKLQKRAMQIGSLLESVSQKTRKMLKPFTDFDFLDTPLKAEMGKLLEHLRRLLSQGRLPRRYQF